VVGTENLPPLVFAAVLTSILIFAVGLPLTRRNAAATVPAPGPAPPAPAEPAPAEPAPTAGLPAGPTEAPGQLPPAHSPAELSPVRTGDTGRFPPVQPPYGESSR
jgi:hypothetical protein